MRLPRPLRIAPNYTDPGLYDLIAGTFAVAFQLEKEDAELLASADALRASLTAAEERIAELTANLETACAESQMRALQILALEEKVRAADRLAANVPHACRLMELYGLGCDMRREMLEDVDSYRATATEPTTEPADG